MFISNVEFFSTVLKKHAGQVKRKFDWQDLTILISPLRNKFIKNLFTAKSREFIIKERELTFKFVIILCHVRYMFTACICTG